MALSATQLQELQTELLLPAYAAFLTPGAEDWQELTEELNRTEGTGITVQETHIGANALRVEVRAAEYPTGNSASDQTARGLLALYLQGVGESQSGQGLLNVAPGTNLRAALSSIFPAGSATRDAWIALLDREGSRIEEMFGVNVRVTRTEVQRAVRGEF